MGLSLPGARIDPPSLKAKVAIEAIKGHRTTAQIVRTYGVHPTLTGLWKRQAAAGLPEVLLLMRELDELYLHVRFSASGRWPSSWA